MQAGSRAEGMAVTKRALTPVACLPCQTRKCRCDGQRPACSSCARRGKACRYDIAEGLSRQGHLKKINEALEKKVKELQESNDVSRKYLGAHATIIAILRDSSDHEATSVLARLRIGETIDRILHYHTLDVS